MLSPTEILELLKKDEIPDYAKEKKSFLSSILSTKKWSKAIETANRILTKSQSYISPQLYRSLVELGNETESIFNRKGEQNLDLQRDYKELIQKRNYLLGFVQKYLKENRIKGDEYKFLRYIIFLNALQVQPYNIGIKNPILSKFPKEYQPEIAILLILGMLKSGNIQTAINEIQLLEKSFLKEENYWNHHFHDLYRIIFQEGELGFSEATSKAIYFYQKALKELQEEDLSLNEKNKDLDWREHHRLEIENLGFYQEVSSLEDDVVIEFCKIVLLSPHFRFCNELYHKKNDKHLNGFLKQISWTEDQLLSFIVFCLKPKSIILLPKAVLKVARALLENGSTKILEMLWAYYPATKKRNTEDKVALKLLKDFAHLRETNQETEATLEQIMASGFEPVPPKTTQNIYKGMIPVQVRPFFRLLREVGDIDIVKFYQNAEKIYFVRFLINGEQFDLQTTNGLGLTIIQPLNTLLFENNIPYQFLAFNKITPKYGFDINNIHSSGVQVTLINEVCYKKYNQDLGHSIIAGFAKSEKPAYAFLKRIEELKPVTLKTDLDKIDLKTDPKFRILRSELDKLKDLPVWTKLLTHCLRYPLDAKPTKAWQKSANEWIEKLPQEDFQNGHVMILEKLMIGEEWFQDTEKLCALRGLTWLSRVHPSKGQYYVLQKIANKAYKKVPGGPLNAKLGNIALETLADIGSLEAFGVINNIEAKAKYSVYKRAIASRKKKFTKLLKMFSPEDLADRSVPTHDLIDGKSSIPLGDVKALLSLDGFKVNIAYELPSGKIQKSVPAHIKSEYAAAIKAVKAEGKSIVESLQSQSKRLEKSWLFQRIWKLENWQTFLGNHSLMQIITQQLIWIMEEGERSISFMLIDGKPVDAIGNEINFFENSNIRLWHPALASVEETLAWRNLIFEKQIKQPFKQAFREVYFLTPAEEATFDHSNRFVGHHLKGNTLYSLGKNREWTMTYEEAPVFKVPGGEWIAILNINGRVLYSECDTMELQFRKLAPGQKANSYYHSPKAPLKDVPPTILSEVMRDVDLFVAVAGLGTDPYFDQNHTGDLLNYWQDASFGKKSKTAISEIRRDLLERLLPMTKLKKVYSFEGNFLKITGTYRTYKINLGSGNILMDPNDQYLCIVPAPNKKLEKKIWLPFEGGDQVLMVILSKAFLLAEDDKITDSSIMAQIRKK